MSRHASIRTMIKRVMCGGLVWLGLAAGASAQTTIVEYVHTDALGSPVAVTDASGAVVPGQSQVYEPYGAPISHGPTDGPGFTGHVEDSATGLTYMQQRYYDADIGLFISSDPISAGAGQFGRYQYAKSNPFRNYDPDGREAKKRERNPVRVAETGSHIVTAATSETGSASVTVGGQATVQSSPNNVKSGGPQPVDTETWEKKATVYDSQYVDSSGPIIIQPGSSAGPLPTNQFYFTLAQRPLAENGTAEPVSAPSDWMQPVRYGSGLTGMFDRAGYRFNPLPSPGPGGVRWYIEIQGGASTHDNSQDPYLNIYVPRDK